MAHGKTFWTGTVKPQPAAFVRPELPPLNSSKAEINIDGMRAEIKGEPMVFENTAISEPMQLEPIRGNLPRELRQVGYTLESVEDVFANPQPLQGKSPLEIRGILGDTNNWRIETLGKGAHSGQGLMLREYGLRGVPTGRIIQWHPGGGHHGANPYWKVSSGYGTFRIFW